MCSRDKEATKLFVVAGEVRPAAAKWQTKRSSGDDHVATLVEPEVMTRTHAFTALNSQADE
jgi:hypothetical protein